MSQRRLRGIVMWRGPRCLGTREGWAGSATWTESAVIPRNRYVAWASLLGTRAGRGERRFRGRVMWRGRHCLARELDGVSGDSAESLCGVGLTAWHARGLGGLSDVDGVSGDSAESLCGVGLTAWHASELDGLSGDSAESLCGVGLT